QVAAEAVEAAVGAGGHHDRVPADERPGAPLQGLVAREPRLLVGRGRVDVRRRDRRRGADGLLPGPPPGAGEGGRGGETCARVGQVEPLARLLRVDVGDLLAEPVDEHALYLRGTSPSRLRPAALFGGTRSEPHAAFAPHPRAMRQLEGGPGAGGVTWTG